MPLMRHPVTHYKISRPERESKTLVKWRVDTNLIMCWMCRCFANRDTAGFNTNLKVTAKSRQFATIVRVEEGNTDTRYVSDHLYNSASPTQLGTVHHVVYK